MNRRNKNKGDKPEKRKATFKAKAKVSTISPRKTRLSKNEKRKLVETVKAEVSKKKLDNVKVSKKKVGNVELSKKKQETVEGTKKKLENVDGTKKKPENVEGTKKKVVNEEGAKKKIENVEGAKKKVGNVERAKKKVGNVEGTKKRLENVEATKKKLENVKVETEETLKPKFRGNKQGSASKQNPMNQRLTEHEAGITEYVSNHEGFSGIIKQRYSDFHVNEIDCDGKVVKLTTLEAPEPPAAAAAEPSEAAEEYLKSTLTEELYCKLKKLMDSNGEEVEIEATDMSKEDRRKLHTAVVKCGKTRLISNTIEKGGKKYIIVKKFSKSGKQDRRSNAWPANRGGEYVYFVLHKENMDTVETVHLIASRLRVKPNMITYAGMKDRRAKTSQLMCVWKIEPQRLMNVSRTLRGIDLGNYSFHQRPLKLGDLRGNRFRIALRNVTGTDEQIEEAVMSLKTKGFLNYYGLQRFGSSLAVPTYEIGKALLLGNWQKAVELILKPREGEPLNFLAEARQVWWDTRDPDKALKILRGKDNTIEGKLLSGLAHHGSKNYLNALDNIPRNSRLMYLHSYQSLIWNKVVSRRMKKYGLQPIAGDLVLPSECTAEPVELMDTVDHDTAVTQESGDSASDSGTSKQKPSVRILSEEDLKDYTIYDTVLPLPGYDITYPQNEVKEWFEELLQEDGLSTAKLKHNVKAYSLGGAYRRIAVCPTDLNWKLVHYSTPHTSLILSDLEEMQNETLPEEDGMYKALILEFCLPPSTYATMAIREILKTDTSCYNQSLLNEYHLAKEVPKERFSSSGNGESVHSPKVQERMETGDSSNVQGSSICTRAGKREKKSMETGLQKDFNQLEKEETSPSALSGCVSQEEGNTWTSSEDPSVHLVKEAVVCENNSTADYKVIVDSANKAADECVSFKHGATKQVTRAVSPEQEKGQVNMKSSLKVSINLVQSFSESMKEKNAEYTEGGMNFCVSNNISSNEPQTSKQTAPPCEMGVSKEVDEVLAVNVDNCAGMLAESFIENTEVPVKRKVSESENDETSPKKVKVEVYTESSLSSIDTQDLAHSESLKRKNLSDVKIDDMENNAENKKLEEETLN